jgi:hypothetical protein
MARDYAAIIAALREKAKRSEFPAEKEALEAKANELEKEHPNAKPNSPHDSFNIGDWTHENYGMTREEFVNTFFRPPPPPPSHHVYMKPSQFIIVITGEDQKWRKSYLWPSDGSPMMNPDHSWTDTDNE